MTMGAQSKKVVYELMGAFVVILLLIILRPLFVGQVVTAGSAYNVTNSATGAVTTITPSATISATQTDTIYSVVIFLVAIIALIVILLTVAGKI